MPKTIACDVIAELGVLHYGRKRVQPSAREVREFRDSAHVECLNIDFYVLIKQTSQ